MAAMGKANPTSWHMKYDGQQSALMKQGNVLYETGDSSMLSAMGYLQGPPPPGAL
jgi:hypothetical protein|uniref:Uncharacterized protein n=1 Tax=Picea glauca TaxID=3330 RepID=A0A101M4V3_PICGL|nr:hypothetical protein ABT39_MTgene830 [Picea glauca]